MSHRFSSDSCFCKRGKQHSAPAKLQSISYHDTQFRSRYAFFPRCLQKAAHAYPCQRYKLPGLFHQVFQDFEYNHRGSLFYNNTTSFMLTQSDSEYAHVVSDKIRFTKYTSGAVFTRNNGTADDAFISSAPEPRCRSRSQSCFRHPLNTIRY